jgi:hypothetical protein
MIPFRSFPLLVLCLFASLPGLAATHVWTGAADDRFSNASNWIGGTPAGDASAGISFAASSRPTATNDLTGLTVQSIAFSAGGFTVSGNGITLAANGTVIDTSAASNTIACNLALGGDVAVAVTGSIYDQKGLTLSGVISGTGGMTLRGGGHLVYTGSQPNTYSGLTRVLYGELQLKKAPNVTAIAGDLVVENDGFNYEWGYLSTFNDEQIANTSHVTIGYLGTFGCGAKETLGPVTLIRSATLQTAGRWSGDLPMTGTVILAGDIEIGGTAQSDVYTYGTFLLQGVRTFNATPGYGVWNVFSGPGQNAAGSGIILNGDTSRDGFATVEFRQATYDGLTTINGGSVRIDAPRSTVDLRNGTYSGHCKSLTAEGGVLNLGSYLGGVTSDGDVKLSPSVTLAHDVGTAMTMNGALDIGSATLQINGNTQFNYGAVYRVVDNASTKPVIGTFANLPEGSMVANRFKISYVGGDGNDVTLTDFGLVSAYISLSVSSNYPQVGTPIEFTARLGVYQQTPTGSVTFSAGTTVLGTAPVTNGVATLSAVVPLPRGHYMVTATYSGDSRVAPGTSDAVNLYVVAPAPTLTSIDPPTITAGVKTTLTVHGTNFLDGSYVLISSSGYLTQFVSPNELHVDYTPFASETDYQLDAWVSQPDPYGTQASAHLKLNVTGVRKPPSPFTFGGSLMSTVTGVTPGAMTLWFADARAGNSIFLINHIVNDTDHDGSVTLPFPFKVTALPPYGVWLVADLSAHTIVSDNPSRTAPGASPFPANVFLRDGDGNYTHLQIAVNGSFLMFAWARPGIGAWMMQIGDGAPIDEDGGPNGRITFETSAMKQAAGTTAPPPADGIRAGDMFLFIDDYGQRWWGDAVDLHLSESNGPGKLGFTVTLLEALENSGTASVLVERTEGTDGTVTVRYATADDTAIAGTNYLAQAGTLTFQPGEIFKSISIPLVDDQSYGGGVQFNVHLSDPAGASIGLATQRVKVVDDEKPPVLSLQVPSTSVPEGDAGQVDIPIIVKLTGRTSLPATVNWYFSEGQYGASHTGELQFAPGETQKTFLVSYTANTVPEPNRVLNLHLWNPTNATVSTDSVSITIVDDDFAGVSVADASVVESAGKVIVPLQLSRASQKPITVTYETRNGTAIAGADYVTTSGTIVVAPGSSITIPLVNDAVHETLKAFEVVLTSVNGGKLDRSVAAVIIVDDDADLPPAPAPPRRRGVLH